MRWHDSLEFGQGTERRYTALLKMLVTSASLARESGRGSDAGLIPRLGPAPPTFGIAFTLPCLLLALKIPMAAAVAQAGPSSPSPTLSCEHLHEKPVAGQPTSGWGAQHGRVDSQNDDRGARVRSVEEPIDRLPVS